MVFVFTPIATITRQHKHVHTGTHMHTDIGMDTRIMCVKQKRNKR